jgi:thioredoxin 1
MKGLDNSVRLRGQYQLPREAQPVAVVELSKETFEDTIVGSPFVVVDFWAPWCGPCRSFAPVYDRVSNDHPDVVFAKVNTEDEQELAAHFHIRSIPTLMIFRDQIIIYQQAGALPEGAFRDLMAKAGELDMDEVRRQIETEHQGTA